jgi:hypothetical protein
VIVGNFGEIGGDGREMVGNDGEWRVLVWIWREMYISGGCGWSTSRHGQNGLSY